MVRLSVPKTVNLLPSLAETVEMMSSEKADDINVLTIPTSVRIASPASTVPIQDRRVAKICPKPTENRAQSLHDTDYQVVVQKRKPCGSLGDMTHPASWLAKGLDRADMMCGRRSPQDPALSFHQRAWILPGPRPA